MLYNSEICKMLKSEISDNELEKLKELEKTKYKKDKGVVRLQQKPLELYFNNKQDIKTRNSKIKKAVVDIDISRVKLLIF